MADEQQTPAGTATSGPATPAAPATFRAVPTSALVAVGFLALCMSPIAFQGGLWFLVFLVPVAVGVWVVRSRTRVDEEGLHVHGLLGSRSVAWSDLTGLRLPEKGWVRAVPANGSEVELRGVRIRDLGLVAEASGHRISAPTPAEAEAAAEHARELEAARMRVAKLRESRAALQADEPEPADQAEPAEQAEPTGQAEPTEQAEPTGQADRTEPTEQAGSTAPRTGPAGTRETDEKDGDRRREA